MKTDLDHITVCICTYKRAEMLSRLIKELQNQNNGELFTYSAVVVDNDSTQSSRHIVEEMRKESSIAIAYHCEPEQNIALARNKAIQNATGNFVTFIDDDEVPHQDWLLNLYKSIHKFKADGVLGPVIPRYEEDPPEWIVKGKFYERPSQETGTILDWTHTRTGNVLLKRSIFDAPDNMFRREFGRGGEDRDFFRRMIDKGFCFVWTREAPVYEAVPRERFTRSFMLRRALLRGRIPYFTVVDVFKSLIAIPAYTCMLPFLLFLGHHHFMKYLIKDCDHVGRILAVCGFDVIRQRYVMK